MNFDTARVQFEVFLTSTLLTVPVQYDNVRDSEELRTAKETNADWARVTIRQGEGFTTEIGTNPNRRWAGILTISFFTQVGKGTKALRDLATDVADEILGHSFTNILVRAPELNIIGIDRESPDWYQANLIVPFEVNQVAT